MKILYDLLFAQPLNGSKYHGGGEYMKAVFAALVSNYSEKVEITVFYNFDLYIEEWIIKTIKEYRIITKNVKSHDEIKFLLETDNFDVFYTGMPYVYKDFCFPKKIYKVATLHGLRGAEKFVDDNAIRYSHGLDKVKYCIKSVFPGYFENKTRMYYTQVFNKFDRIITDSQHSACSFKVFLPSRNKDTLIDVCYAPNKYGISDAEKQILSEDKFILMIGANRWEKNIYRAVKAINNLLDKGLLKDYKIVICGSVANCIKKAIKGYEQYILPGFVTNELLDSLYEDCDIFLFPSLNEGFGMPPLEAMSYGKTCIVSCVCSLPEICGDAVYWVNPYDVKEIENRIIMAADNKISTRKIQNQFNKVKNKQEVDLEKICKIIIEQYKG